MDTTFLALNHDDIAEALRDEATPLSGTGDSDASMGAVFAYTLTEPLIIPGFVTVPAGHYTRHVWSNTAHVHVHASQDEALSVVARTADRYRQGNA